MSLAVQLQDTGNVVALCGVPLVLGELVLYGRGRANPSMEAAGYALFSAGDILTGIGSLMQAQWGAAPGVSPLARSSRGGRGAAGARTASASPRSSVPNPGRCAMPWCASSVN